MIKFLKRFAVRFRELLAEANERRISSEIYLMEKDSRIWLVCNGVAFAEIEEGWRSSEEIIEMLNKSRRAAQNYYRL